MTCPPEAGGSTLYQPAIFHRQPPVTQSRQFFIMRYDQEGLVERGTQVAEQFMHFQRGMTV